MLSPPPVFLCSYVLHLLVSSLSQNTDFSKNCLTLLTRLWVYNSENRFVGSFYQFTCRVKRVKRFFEKSVFWDRLIFTGSLIQYAQWALLIVHQNSLMKSQGLSELFTSWVDQTHQNTGTQSHNIESKCSSGQNFTVAFQRKRFYHNTYMTAQNMWKCVNKTLDIYLTTWLVIC